MGRDPDGLIAAAGYWDTKISQEHASQKNRGGSQLSRDQKNREREHMRADKNRLGWVPVKPGLKQKEREHMRAEKEGGGWVPVQPGPKQRDREHMRAEKDEGVVGPS